MDHDNGCGMLILDPANFNFLFEFVICDLRSSATLLFGWSTRAFKKTLLQLNTHWHASCPCRSLVTSLDLANPCLQSSHGFYSSGLVGSPVIQSSYALRSMECPTVTPSITIVHTSCPWKRLVHLLHRWFNSGWSHSRTRKFRACIAAMKQFIWAPVFGTISWALHSSSKQVIVSASQTCSVLRGSPQVNRREGSCNERTSGGWGVVEVLCEIAMASISHIDGFSSNKLALADYTL